MAGPCSWMARLYNRISPKGSEQSTRDRQAVSNMPSSPSSFYYNELNRTLSEQSFGLAGYEVARQQSAHEATATVTLLEGSSVNVSLNVRGYRLDGGQTYESIEELLQSISPMYLQKRQDAIISRLQGLQ